MSLPAQLPLCQWLVPGSLKDVSAKMRDWQERQSAGLQIEPFDEEGTDTEQSICLHGPLWGEFGRLRLAYVDRGQTLLGLYWPPYPTPAETAVYEAQIRRLHSAARVQLCASSICTGRKNLCLTWPPGCTSGDCLAWTWCGPAWPTCSVESRFAPVPMDQLVPPSGEIRTNSPNIPNARKHPKRDISRTKESDTRLLKLWSDGLSVKQIARQTGKTEKTILNRLSLLRKTLGEQAVPRRR